MPQDDQKVVEIIQMADAALTKSAAYEEAQEKLQKRAAELIPHAVKALVDGQRIEAKDGEKVAAVLKDHLRTLELLTKVAKHRNAEEVGKLGSQVKAASDNGRKANRPGYKTKDESQASQDLYSRIMGNRV